MSLSAAGATGTFASRNAGTNIVVNTTGFSLMGAQQADYQLVQPAGLSATITPATLTITGVALQLGFAHRTHREHYACTDHGHHDRQSEQTFQRHGNGVGWLRQFHAVTRLQSLSSSSSLYVALNGQLASKNPTPMGGVPAVVGDTSSTQVWVEIHKAFNGQPKSREVGR